MSSSFFTCVRGPLLALCCIAPLALVQAQNAPQPAPAVPEQLQNQEQPSPRQNQKIEHIHVEDGGATVDEVRYGGQTQSISVQPKANVPGYEVLPSDGGRARQGAAETSAGGNGPRVWNLLKF